MIKIVNGDILECSEDIIAHQCNTLGLMGAGLALQIKNKYPNVYSEYRKKCQVESADDLMGYTLMLRESINDKIIANIFAQREVNSNKRCTEYHHLFSGLCKLKNLAKARNLSVAIPFNLGCGLAGGDWSIVYDMIEKAFEDYSVTLYKFEV